MNIFNKLEKIFAEETGIECKNTGLQSYYGHSFEAQLSENLFIYLEEARNGIDSLVGYRLSLCLVDEKLSDKLLEGKKLPEDKKNEIEKYFEDTLGSSSIDWYPGAKTGQPYVREIDTSDPSNKRFQADKRCLWVDLRTSERDLESIRPDISAFKEACENFPGFYETLHLT